MNKQKLFAALLLGLTVHNVSAAPIDRAQAERIARNFVQKGRNAVAPFRLLKAKEAVAGDKADADVQPYYVFNSTARDGGFVIVSGDDRFASVLGYADSGSFSLDDAPDNVRQWMQQYARYVEAYWAKGEDGGTVSAGETAPTVVAGPLLGDIEWGQDYPFNEQCPTYAEGTNTVHYYTGCVATAATQIMRYWKYPERGTGSKTYTAKGMTLSADFASTTYDWANMLADYPKGSTFFTKEQTDAVATLAAHFGVAVEMEYEKAGSGAVPMLVPAALKKYFGYDRHVALLKRNYYSTGEWMDIMRREIDAGRPVYYGGASDSGSGGHAFVADGYDSNGYVHINWGWYGKSNGYFLVNRLNPDELGEGGGTGGYNLDQEMVIGIQPPADNGADVLLPLYGSTRLGVIASGSELTLMTFLENLDTEEFSGKLAAVVVKDGRVCSVLKEEHVGVGAYKNGVSGTYSLTMRGIPVRADGLADGNYEVRLAFKADGASGWQLLRHYTGLPRYADMTVSGGKAVVSGAHAIKPDVTLLTPITADGTVHAGGKAMLSMAVRNNSTDVKLREVVVKFESAGDKSVCAVSSAKVNVYEESTAELKLLVDVDPSLAPGDYRLTACEKGYDDCPFDASSVGESRLHVLAATDNPVLRMSTPVVWQTKEGATEAVQGDDVLMSANVRNYGNAGKVGIVAHLRDVNDEQRDFVFIQTDATIARGELATINFYRKMVVDPGTYEIRLQGIAPDGSELAIESAAQPAVITVGESPNIKLNVTAVSLPQQLVIGERVSGNVSLHADADFNGTIYVRVRQLTNRNGEIVTMATKSIKAGNDITLAFNYRPAVSEGTYMLIVETKENGKETTVGGCDNYYRIMNIGSTSGIGSIGAGNRPGGVDAVVDGDCIRLAADGDTTVSRAELFSIGGTLVVSADVVANTVHTGHVPCGIYLLRLYTSSGILTKRIVKSR